MKKFHIYTGDADYWEVKADDFYIEGNFVVFIRIIENQYKSISEKVAIVPSDKFLFINFEFEE